MLNQWEERVSRGNSDASEAEVKESLSLEACSHSAAASASPGVW